MKFIGGARDAGSTAGRKQGYRRGKWAALATLGLAPLVILSSPGVASAASWECLENSDGSQTDIVGNGSTDHQTKSVGVQQANKTWQDWVWRGDQHGLTFQCPWNVPSCSYSWQQSHTEGWKWSVGLSLKVPIPYVSDILGGLTPGYERNGSTTTAFTFTTNLSPGQFAAPIQVVERRWTQGVFQGVYHSTGNRCLSSPSNPNHSAWKYTWSDEKWGSWTTNVHVSDYGTYHVWK